VNDMISKSFKPARVIPPYLALCAFAVLINPASADQKKASACAANLPQGARTVFDAAAKEAVTAADLRALIESKTRSLVMSGGLARADARSSAEAAGECLKLIRAS
jgi:hypothetical protein